MSLIRHVCSLGCSVAIVFLAASASAQDYADSKADAEGVFALLDLDGNQKLTPYEGADAILQLLKLADQNKDGLVDALELKAALINPGGIGHEGPAEMFAEADENGDGVITLATEVPEEFQEIARSADADKNGSLTLKEFSAIDLGEIEEEDEEHEGPAEMFAEADENGDGVITLATEVPEEFQEIARSADADKNGSLTLKEFSAIDLGEIEEEGEEHEGPAEMFAEADENGDGRITSDELPESLRDEMLDFADSDGDGVITRAEFESALTASEAPASFVVNGKRCVMTGVIGPSTPNRVLELIREHPEVEVIEMRNVPGSMDDPSNLRAARLIRKHGLATHVPSDGTIASGGVDFFLAGAKRSVDKGGRLGVHSWGGGPIGGDRLPREHPMHRLYLDFYKEIGTPEDFYWYTLKAASPEDIYWMTAEEMNRFKVATPTASR